MKPDAPDRITEHRVEAPATLLAYLTAGPLADRSRTTAKAMLRYGHIAINGTPVTLAGAPLAAGDTVSINHVRPFTVFNHRRLKLVYEDADIIVVNKGYGLLSMGTGRQGEETAYNILRQWVKRQDTRNKLFIVHRLDRDTSGLMMFAKNERAKETMQHNWSNMVRRRTYVAVVDGTVEEDEGTVRSWLSENSAHEVYSSPVEVPGSKLAVTRWRVVARGKGRTLLELNLATGRKNQIRVHMKELGHPITGDRRYGGSVSPIHRLALHAKTLEIVHPATRQAHEYATDIPPAFRTLV